MTIESISETDTRGSNNTSGWGGIESNEFRYQDSLLHIYSEKTQGD